MTVPLTISALGEFGLLARVFPRLPQGRATLLGPGDDAAMVAVHDGQIAVSTDLLIEGQHFRRDWSGPYEIGRKAAAQSLADIAAMGGVATSLLIGLGCPAELEVTWVDTFADGLREECGQVGAGVVGGDLSRADTIVIAVTALGSVWGSRPVTRSGAQPGDIVAVAGRLGWSAAGFAVLSRGFRTPRALVEAHRRPEVPYAAGPAAAQLGATAMCDVSDGLVADLGRIAQASQVCVELDTSRFEVAGQMRDAAQALGLNPVQWVLCGGEDHALVATFPPGTSLPDQWHQIGRVTRGRGVFVDGKPHDETGFDHFK